MNAKDTMIKEPGNPCLNCGVQEPCEKCFAIKSYQRDMGIYKLKEISYKAGYKEAFKSQLYNEGYQAGIREVVEWVEEHLLGEEYPPWQAQKKEWLNGRSIKKKVA